MFATNRSDLVKLTVAHRVFMFVLGGGLLTLLATAAWLAPSPRGLGTHQQLGLPPCTFIQFAGIRCPACGMTTSWAHLVRGQLWSGMRANVGGVLCGALAMGIAPWFLVSAIRGAWWIWQPTDRDLVTACLATMVVILLDWFVRLAWGL